MKNERDVKQQVKKVLAECEAWWFMPVQTGMGVMGAPDFIVSYRGKFIGIETKYGKNTLSEWQKIQRDKILASGGAYIVINETNVRELKEWILHLT